MDDESDKHWRIDRRISVGHLWTVGAGIIIFIGLIATSIFQITTMEERINAHDRTHEQEAESLRVQIASIHTQHIRDITRMEQTDTIQYTEIIRRLEMLQSQLNEFSRGTDK